VLLRSRVGKGSVFAVTVARGHLDEQTLLESSPPRVTGHFDLRGRLVLLVHGRFAVRQELTELLGAWSCEVVAAGSLTEMLGLLGALPRPPDLIMAEHDDADSGAAVVDLLRNDFNFEVPALLVGTADPAGAPIDVRGVLPILYRPCNAGRLRTLISNLLHPPRIEPVQARRAS
jgi:CheY-like chemotaxis protein